MVPFPVFAIGVLILTVIRLKVRETNIFITRMIYYENINMILLHHQSL